MKVLSTALAAVVVASGASAAVINFEQFDKGEIISTTDGSSYFAVAGVDIEVTAAGGSDDAMIFDTNPPVSGQDTDLAAPFYKDMVDDPDRGGAWGLPVDGTDTLTPNNVLIISEDGDSSDPDDNQSGGQIVFNFSQMITFMGFDVLDDVENFSVTANTGESETGITLDFNNQFASFTGLNWTGVNSLLFDFGNASGAIDNLQFEVAPVPVPASLPLLLAGFAGLGALSRRRKS